MDVMSIEESVIGACSMVSIWIVSLRPRMDSANEVCTCPKYLIRTLKSREASLCCRESKQNIWSMNQVGIQNIKRHYSTKSIVGFSQSSQQETPANHRPKWPQCPVEHAPDGHQARQPSRSAQLYGPRSEARNESGAVADPQRWSAGRTQLRSPSLWLLADHATRYTGWWYW